MRWVGVGAGCKVGGRNDDRYVRADRVGWIKKEGPFSRSLSREVDWRLRALELFEIRISIGEGNSRFPLRLGGTGRYSRVSVPATVACDNVRCVGLSPAVGA